MAFEVTLYTFLSLDTNTVFWCFAIKDGIVIAATTPIIPRVINTSARVKPFCCFSCIAALHGLFPAPIPVKELKLLCPPPGKSCYYCVFHNLISFFSFAFIFSFLRENIYFLKHALTPFTLSFRKQIFSLIFLFVFLWQCLLLSN